MAKVAALLAMVVLASCSGKKEKDKGAGAVGTGGHVKVTCDNTVPETFRAKYLAGAKLKKASTTADQIASCDFEFADDPNKTFDVSTSCIWDTRETKAEILANQKKSNNMVDLPGVGEGAVVMDAAGGAKILFAFDTDSVCSIMLTVSAGFDAPAMANELLAGLPPK